MEEKFRHDKLEHITDPASAFKVFNFTEELMHAKVSPKVYKQHLNQNKQHIYNVDSGLDHLRTPIQLP